MQVDFDTVADELYSLPLEEFTAVRAAREKEAKAAGDADCAGEVHKLAKPNTVGWLVNQLVRRHPAEIQPLIELGDDLRAAIGSGDRLRELSRLQRRLISALVEEARQLARDAERTVSADTARGVADTLRAALADEAAARQLLAGRLTGALFRSGLADDTEPKAAPREPAGSRESPSEPAGSWESPREPAVSRESARDLASTSARPRRTTTSRAAAAGPGAAAPGAGAPDAAAPDATASDATGADATGSDAAEPEPAARTAAEPGAAERRRLLRRERAGQERANQLAAAATDARQQAQTAVDLADRAVTDAAQRVQSLQTELAAAQAAQADAERELRRAGADLQTAQRVEREAGRRLAAVRTP